MSSDSPRNLREPLYAERNELSTLMRLGGAHDVEHGVGGGTFPESNVPASEPKPAHKTYFTFLVIAANCAMFVVSIWKNGWKFQPLSENPMFGPSSATLISLGAKQASLIRTGQV